MSFTVASSQSPRLRSVEDDIHLEIWRLRIRFKVQINAIKSKDSKQKSGLEFTMWRQRIESVMPKRQECTTLNDLSLLRQTVHPNTGYSFSSKIYRHRKPAAYFQRTRCGQTTYTKKHMHLLTQTPPVQHHLK